ncbi:MAG: septum site-determining protein MinC [Acaryochloridaceae cyanobacterium RL_2_7]|nr:septum site-determining protein MinC [Acaryochloridaceae cyanobacterium RL_2_7]
MKNSQPPPISGAKQSKDDFSDFFRTQPVKPIELKVLEDRVVLIFPAQNKQDDDWQALVQRLNQRLAHPHHGWADHAQVDLILGARLLDGRQLLLISKLLQNAKLTLDCVHTNRRQTAMAAVTAGYSVQQTSPESLLAKLADTQDAAQTPIQTPAIDPHAPLFLKKTVRSGMEVIHGGSLFLLGDVNPGGKVAAEGDIIVWGRLRGVAHAGMNASRDACIMALTMEPTQLRIADKVARAPSGPLEEFYPEVAHIAAEGIRITRAYDYSRLN